MGYVWEVEGDRLVLRYTPTGERLASRVCRGFSKAGDVERWVERYAAAHRNSMDMEDADG